MNTNTVEARFITYFETLEPAFTRTVAAWHPSREAASDSATARNSLYVSNKNPNAYVAAELDHPSAVCIGKDVDGLELYAVADIFGEWYEVVNHG